MKTRPLLKLLIFSFTLGVTGCFKESTENFVEEEVILENAAIAEQQADEALELIYQCEVILKLYPGQIISYNGCALFYEDPLNKLIVLDFGSDTVCATFYGKYRHGKIMASYTTSVGDTLDSRVLTFENYRTTNSSTAPVRFIQVSGSVSLTNIIQVSPTRITADRNLTDFNVLMPDGSGVTFNGTEQRAWTGGMGDTLEFNNVYSLLGSMDGVSSTGRKFRQAIDGDDPVVINFDCAARGRFARTSGLMALIQLDGYPERKRFANYGDGTCLDNGIEIQTFRRTFGVTAY